MATNYDEWSNQSAAMMNRGRSWNGTNTILLPSNLLYFNTRFGVTAPTELQVNTKPAISPSVYLTMKSYVTADLARQLAAQLQLKNDRYWINVANRASGLNFKSIDEIKDYLRNTLKVKDDGKWGSNTLKAFDVLKQPSNSSVSEGTPAVSSTLANSLPNSTLLSTENYAPGVEYPNTNEYFLMHYDTNPGTNVVYGMGMLPGLKYAKLVAPYNYIDPATRIATEGFSPSYKNTLNDNTDYGLVDFSKSFYDLRNNPKIWDTTPYKTPAKPAPIEKPTSPLYYMRYSPFKQGGKINYFLQGGVMQLDPVQQVIDALILNPQETVLQLVQLLKLNKQQVDAILQEIASRAKSGDTKAQLALLALNPQKAEKGAKLNYINHLRGKCAEDEELVYMKKGGAMCPVCLKKKVETAKCGGKKFFTEDKCGGKVKADKCGGKAKKKAACGCKIKKALEGMLTKKDSTKLKKPTSKLPVGKIIEDPKTGNSSYLDLSGLLWKSRDGEYWTALKDSMTLERQFSPTNAKTDTIPNRKKK